MQKITPFLWFDNNAEEAIDFYVSVFPDARKGRINRMPSPHPELDGTLVTGSFTLFGQEYMVMNGGPRFKFTEAVSFFVSCKDQAEVDMYWDALSAGGEVSMCGWLKDKFGLSWQIVPDALGYYLNSGDGAASKRVMNALLKMSKINIEILKQAYENHPQHGQK